MASVVIDSSAWIDFFRRASSPSAAALTALVRANLACITPLIRVELLSGTRTESEHRLLEDQLTSIPVLDEPDDFWNRVARSRFKLARRGVQSSVVDVSIAVMANIHGCAILTLDRQFGVIAKTIPFPLYPLTA
jgi:predicted nucleic acid-binding protein